MIRSIALCMVVLFAFASCGKKTDSNPTGFLIDGLHDIAADNPSNNFITYAVSSPNNTQEQVTISVSGLPVGVTAALNPASGIPKFGGTINFSWDGTTPQGTYPFKVTGTSASYTKSYDLNLTVSSSLSGFFAGGLKYNTSDFYRDVFNGKVEKLGVSSNDYGKAEIRVYGDIPTADGTYNFAISDARTSSSALDLTFLDFATSKSYGCTGTTPNAATLKISGGNMHLIIHKITLSGIGHSGTIDVSVNAYE